jgi:hypothetical protein
VSLPSAPIAPEKVLFRSYLVVKVAMNCKSLPKQNFLLTICFY